MKATKLALPDGDAPFVRAPGIRRAGIARVFHRIPFDKVNWPTSSFLIGTFLLSLTLVPAYIWYFGLDWFQITLFLVMFLAVGFSIIYRWGLVRSLRAPFATNASVIFSCKSKQVRA
jgi:hypothetical protein